MPHRVLSNIAPTHLYFFGSLGDLMISGSPWSSAAAPPSVPPAATWVLASCGGGSPWSGTERTLPPLADLLVWGISTESCRVSERHREMWCNIKWYCGGQWSWLEQCSVYRTYNMNLIFFKNPCSCKNMWLRKVAGLGDWSDKSCSNKSFRQS